MSEPTSVLAKLNGLFEALLDAHAGGISNTSTTKYDEIRGLIARELQLDEEHVYATGATTRISNLDTRLAQGNQRNQHDPLAIAFLRIPTNGRDRDEVMQKTRASFRATCGKFVTGEERGTTFDGILGLIQLDDERSVAPLTFLGVQGCEFLPRLKAAFPGIRDESLRRVAGLAAASAVVATAPSPATQGQGPHAAPRSLDSGLIATCGKDLASAGLRLPDGLLARFVAALLTKRFVILTGLAGSGKTKLALGFAKWLEEVDGQVELVAVGADWTNSENVLGYRDALDPSKYRRPANGALDVIIRASGDTRRPYFLILDEMNLSHVERYFADLLSAIESGESIALHSGTDDVDGIPPRVRLPDNLFIIGTVNVDETTYMFSPKVLDRANVIEFRATADDMRTFLTAPSPVRMDRVQGLGQVYAGLVVEVAASAAPALASLPLEIADGGKCEAELSKQLVELFELLVPIGAEYGYRSALEIVRFTCLHALLVGSGWTLNSALDAQVLQKLMPKLHGSERRLRPILEQLQAYAKTANLPMSEEKVRRMQDRLRDGFASFLD
jgi:hypothetical protein